MRYTKQDRIDELERWNEQLKQEIRVLKSQQDWSRNHQRQNNAKHTERADILKAALGDIINRIDRAILRRRSTDTERAIKGVAKQALEATKG